MVAIDVVAVAAFAAVVHVVTAVGAARLERWSSLPCFGELPA